jgi:hypothetical protein
MPLDQAVRFARFLTIAQPAEVYRSFLVLMVLTRGSCSAQLGSSQTANHEDFTIDNLISDWGADQGSTVVRTAF